MDCVHLLLGEFGPYTPPPGCPVPLLLGEQALEQPVFCGAPIRLRWGAIDRAAADAVDLPWSAVSSSPGAADVRLPWSGMDPGPQAIVRLPWAVNQLGGALSVRAPWGRGAAGHAGPVRAPWGRAEGRTRAVGVPWGRARAGHAGPLALPWARAGARSTQARLPWGLAWLVVGPRPRQPGEGVHGSYPPAVGCVHLHFCVPPPWSTDLVLGFEACVTQPRVQTAITGRRSYVHTHSLSAVRLPDLEVLPIEAFSITADVDAYGWTLTADGPASLLSLLAPTGGLPALMRLTLDGLVFEFVVQGLRRNRSFGVTTATITGRSQAALLADPYRAPRAHLNAVPMTAQQLVEDALEFTGVTLDWQLTDWTVPAGAWSHTGTPMSAARAVADAAGAVLASPRAGASLIVAPRYPVLPWDWAAATPDVVIALDAVETEGYERDDRPPYEGVYVSGQAQGVLALVKRTGTAPALYAPMVTDALIAHLDAARQRGESILGAAGPQARMVLSLPVLTGVGEPGVIDPGLLVEVPDPAGAWRGITRGVSVAGESVSDVLVSVRQTLTVERHL